MAIWDKVKTELEQAGRAAQGALDEGRLRLEVFRVRQLADKAAQALGYAVFRAKQGGGDLDADTYARLSSTLGAHEAEATRLEERIRDIARTGGSPAADDTDPAAPPPPPPPGPSSPPI